MEIVKVIIAALGIGGTIVLWHVISKKRKTTHGTPDAKVLVICPYCGAKTEQGMTTCRKCGAKL